METNTVDSNTKTKSSINELDAYFNTLLKSQSEENNVNPARKYKLISLVFLILVICASLYFAVGFYVNSTNSSLTGSTATNGENSGAYFNPEYYSNRDRKISGKISKNFGNPADKRLTFELVDASGGNIAYLYSENNDLNLSVGLNVEINGEFKDTADDGTEIIEVSSVKLK